MKYEKEAQEILEYVGGSENIKTVTHCATRLRFTLKNDELVKEEALKNLADVIGTVNQGGQFQIIIGNDVKYVYKALQQFVNISEENDTGVNENKTVLNKVLDTVAGIFVPIVPALAGSGMLKAVLAIVALLGWINTDGQTYQILNFVSDAIFYFLPMLLAHSASVKFGTNPYLSITIGGILLHPTFTAMITNARETGGTIQLFGLPVTPVNYGSSVIPIILTIWFMSFIEPFVDKIVPKVTRIFSTPLITLFIVAPVALIVIGPLGTFLGDGLAGGIRWLDNYASWLIPMVVGTFTPLLVMTGMHYALISIGINSLAKFGFDTVAGPGMLVSNIAQGGAVLAVALRSKNMKLRSLGISTGISAVLGITEPALYGINLTYRKPLYSAMIGGGLGGLFLGIMGVGRYQQVPPGILALPSFIGEDGLSNLTYTIIGIVIAFVGAFVSQLFLGIDDKEDTIIENEEATIDPQTAPEVGARESISVTSPMAGQVLSLSQVNDDVFSQKLLGEGLAIVPKDGLIYAPFDGVISVFLESKHAIGIVGSNGVELLIHCGLDTVNLIGEGFVSHVNKGDTVKKGDLLLEMDIAYIRSKHLETTTPILVTNTKDYLEVLPTTEEEVQVGEVVLSIE
ncbi:beta-glucoside-specific PTS transporter subunit IIABC [Enterococcus sp. DIV0756]|uniref:beta-glucoside-specific PTS transporter subunit IIABC n=1 Tax=Enterococcus sp. DIV0756 TaxID=2774636 RepID=UPI003F258890